MTEKDLRQAAITHLDSLIPHELGWSSTVSLVLVRGETLHQFGTGTLFRIADDSFLVTATHVIDDARQEDLRLCPGNGKIVPLAGKMLLSDRRHLDVAVVHLPPQVVEHLYGKTFLRSHHVSFDEDLSDGIFTLFGFPEIWANDDKGTFSRKGFHLTTYPFTGDPSGLENHDASEHLLLQGAIGEAKDIKGEPLRFCYRSGDPAPFPGGLGGISGCSVWKIGDAASAARSSGSDGARLVAVQTGVYSRSECIKATRWSAAASMIYTEFPELRPAMDLLQRR